jgi:hypothetical protein
MKPYILDDASSLEYQRLDLMSKILDSGVPHCPLGRPGLAVLGARQRQRQHRGVAV